VTIEVSNPVHVATYYPQDFPVSRPAWHQFGLAEIERETRNDEVQAAHRLADRLNAEKAFHRPGVKAASAGELLAMGLLSRAFRLIAWRYCLEFAPGVLSQALLRVRKESGATVLETATLAFTKAFPPITVHRGEVVEESFLAMQQGLATGRETVTVESILLAITNENPALTGYRDLHSDVPLRGEAAYASFLATVEAFFEEQPPVPGAGKSLFKTLRAPIHASPDDLEGQLEFIRERWAALLPPALLQRLLLARGVLREERQFRGHGPGPVEALRFSPGDEAYAEPEAFSPDKDWMPNVVLLAKQTYVWLGQLSAKYQRPIDRLDQVPTEELALLASWGITGLWLIGLWERSSVSRDIKRRMGNPEAEASAYSLYDYTIAADLGGEAAYRDLSARAWSQGIRLASDMVPNHVGIYSKWVVEHPNWFIQLDQPPYPAYQFNGPDLSPDGRVSIQIEDGYWDKRDAAVVFKRQDRHTGQVAYLYHGNDGTSMPWNDTAQLNFLLAEVREAVIQTILHVARMFPIIRFDAAMTLAKKHYQRLWFPKAGDEGAVPSRAQFGLSRAEFDTVFPNEFWREVVDRVAMEAPDTLLLAEAFWLMEGYFVRTLGMHRVYNSAFMNMLKLEENAKFRMTIKNVLEFSPEILQRFVNFMNNPDEDTAEAQFGKGDKYFGVAVLLATMPGLPMIGHGQVEGYSEKYGMEYRRAYKDEGIDWGLLTRHEHQIFPLLRQRWLFSGAQDFAFYDFIAPDGSVNENVIAYSNRKGDSRAVVLYNNSIHIAHGSVYLSSAMNKASAEAPVLQWRTLAQALGLSQGDSTYYIYEDQQARLQYLIHSRQLAEYGLSAELSGYACRVLMHWSAVEDHDLSWARLHANLAGQGVPNIWEEYQELFLENLLNAFHAIFNAGNLAALLSDDCPAAQEEALLDAIEDFYTVVAEREHRPEAPISALMNEIHAEIRLLRELLWEEASETADAPPMIAAEFRPALFAWAVLRRLGRIVEAPSDAATAGQVTTGAWMREWLLVKHLQRAFSPALGDVFAAQTQATLAHALITHGPTMQDLPRAIWAPRLAACFHDSSVRAFLRANHYSGQTYVNKEQMEIYLELLLFTTAIAEGKLSQDDDIELLACALRAILDAAGDCGYDLEMTLAALA